jgi:hypothetical protein
MFDGSSADALLRRQTTGRHFQPSLVGSRFSAQQARQRESAAKDTKVKSITAPNLPRHIQRSEHRPLPLSESLPTAPRHALDKLSKVLGPQAHAVNINRAPPSPLTSQELRRHDPNANGPCSLGMSRTEDLVSRQCGRRRWCRVTPSMPPSPSMTARAVSIASLLRGANRADARGQPQPGSSSQARLPMFISKHTKVTDCLA